MVSKSLGMVGFLSVSQAQLTCGIVEGWRKTDGGYPVGNIICEKEVCNKCYKFHCQILSEHIDRTLLWSSV